MIAVVARALGPDMLAKVAFVGGCTTGLLLTDAFSKQQVRHTDDVDLIVHVVGHVGLASLQTQLVGCGFSHSMEDDSPICAMRLGQLRVDFMPDDVTVLGFTNRWYAQALQSAQPFALPDGQVIRLLTPAFFVATKLEAYLGRGNNDPLGSRDLEDILTLVDGRAELVQDLQTAGLELRSFVATELRRLMPLVPFSYAVTSAAGNDEGRERLIFERLEALVGMVA
jgi:predicted nucleotidyltransferase